MNMSNTYSWNFPAFDVTKQQGDYTDVVYTIHWRLSGVDQTTSHSVELYGLQPVTPYNPDSGSFIPYDQLTKETVTDWVIDSMGEKYGELTSSINNRIDAMIAPKMEQLPPPWIMS
jgi:hypothetical protein